MSNTKNNVFEKRTYYKDNLHTTNKVTVNSHVFSQNKSLD